MLLVDDASILMFDNILGHSQGEAFDEIRRIGSDYCFPARFILDFGDYVSHLLDPISHEINRLFMVELVGSDDVLGVCGRQVFLEGLHIYLLIEVKMAHLSLVILEALSPLGCVDELYSKLVVVLTLDTDQGQKKPFWPQGASDSFCGRLDVVDPMNCAETYDCVELSHVLELGVQVLLEVAHLRLRPIFFLGNLYQIC